MILRNASRAIYSKAEVAKPDVLTLSDTTGWKSGADFLSASPQGAAMKLSTVNACVEILSNSVAKLPIFLMNKHTKERITDHSLIYLLSCRPNEIMTPAVYKKLTECSRLLHGNAYSHIIRNKRTAKAEELLYLPPGLTEPHIDESGKLWYIVTNPKTGEQRKLRSWDIIHMKAYSEDGIRGISVLTRARNEINTALFQQAYEHKFYSQGARPSGIVTVATQVDKEAKTKVRDAFERMVSGVDGAFRVAVLDMGMEYKQMSLSNVDAQFVESKGIRVEDIARFFGVPLYKLQAGKQSYNSNEQNAIDYVVSTLHPTVTQYEEEYTYKGLFADELKKGLEVRINLNAELRGDFVTRSSFYKSMREIGALNADEIRDLEDEPPIEGGQEYYASLNYVPLSLFRELSINRNNAKNKNAGENEEVKK